MIEYVITYIEENSDIINNEVVIVEKDVAEVVEYLNDYILDIPENCSQITIMLKEQAEEFPE